MNRTVVWSYPKHDQVEHESQFETELNTDNLINNLSQCKYIYSKIDYSNIRNESKVPKKRQGAIAHRECRKIKELKESIFLAHYLLVSFELNIKAIESKSGTLARIVNGKRGRDRNIQEKTIVFSQWRTFPESSGLWEKSEKTYRQMLYEI